MKKSILFFLFLLNQILFSQVKLDDSEKYRQIGLVWGLIKYHHPEVSYGKFDWDNELLTFYKNSINIDTQTELNLYLLEEIYKINKNSIFENKKTKIEPSKIFIKNEDYSWINEKIFGEKLFEELLKIKENTNIGEYYAKVSSLTIMVSFDNGKGYKNFKYQDKFHRLLFLFSFWNMNQYWNVNKYLMDKNWLSIIDAEVANFADANSKMKFEIAKEKLISKLNDSHSFRFSKIILDSLYKYYPVFTVKILNDSMVVNYIKNKELAMKNNIELGDVIVKINNQKINNYIQSNFASLFSYSNETYLKKWLGHSIILSNNIDSINVDIIKKNGGKTNTNIKLFSDFDTSNFESINKRKREKWTFISPEIGYLSLEEVDKNEIKEAFNKFNNTKGIIIDLRNYPEKINNSDISKYILSEKKTFIKVLMPIKSAPSISEYDADAPLDFVSNPFKTGKKSNTFYKGKIILLVDRNTISKAEFIGMSIQQSENCLTIGEQTAGTPMNVVTYTLSDNTTINFTGIQTFYPNGDCVQRNGLHIDYKIEENAKNYDSDLYIKTAIKLIENN